MNTRSLAGIVLLSTLIAQAALAHGGPYPVPPPNSGGGGGRQGGGGGGGPGNQGPGDTVPPGPATGGPSGPAGPTTGGGGYDGPGPSTPSHPDGPKTGGGSGGGTTTRPPAKTPGPPSGPSTGGASEGPDPTSWESWWYYNKDRYLNLKSHVVALDVVTGSDDDFLGSGKVSVDANVVADRVIPVLTGLLEHERDQDEVTGAVVALARLADGPLAARAPELVLARL